MAKLLAGDRYFYEHVTLFSTRLSLSILCREVVPHLKCYFFQIILLNSTYDFDFKNTGPDQLSVRVTGLFLFFSVTVKVNTCKESMHMHNIVLL